MKAKQGKKSINPTEMEKYEARRKIA